MDSAERRFASCDELGTATVAFSCAGTVSINQSDGFNRSIDISTNHLFTQPLYFQQLISRHKHCQWLRGNFYSFRFDNRNRELRFL